MNALTLTKREKTILDRIAKPYFPPVTFWCIAVFVTEGIAAAVFSVRGCFAASDMVEHENPEAIVVLIESCILLNLASIALFSAMWAGAIRSYGMLLRKLLQQQDRVAAPTEERQ